MRSRLRLPGLIPPELDKFAKQNGVQVRLEVIPWSDLYKRILTATSSGEGPEVLNSERTRTLAIGLQVQRYLIRGLTAGAVK